MSTSQLELNPADGPNRVKRFQRVIVVGLALWVLTRTALVTIGSWHNRIMRAEMGMATGLVALWIAVCGSLMYLLRDRIKASLTPLRANWRISFFLLATALAMSEEVITTLMTNFAPLFGVKLGEAYITASANYFDLIGCHSVVTFLPSFAVWTWLYSRYDFSPYEVFVCFGAYGFLGETIYGGFHLLDLGFWILVYGLMIYLPAYVFAENRGKRPVSWPQYLMGTIGPFAFTIPWVVLLKFTLLHHHPDVHFPPIRMT